MAIKKKVPKRAFKKGHIPWNKKNFEKNKLIYCACGCGEKRWKYNKNMEERRFINGHQSRSMKLYGEDSRCNKCGNNRKWCKELCEKCYKKIWEKKNAKRLKEKRRLSYLENKEELSKKSKEKYKKDELLRKKISIRGKKYREKHREELKEKKKIYYYENHKSFLKKNEKHRKENKNQMREWRENNRKHIRDYTKERLKNDKAFNIKKKIRNSLAKAFRKYTKTGKTTTSSKYGINHNAIIKHLKPFPADLSSYHIDHIKPLASFNFINKDGSTNLEEVKKAFAPENHQWLRALDNMSKGKKIIKQSKLNL